jgi:hypothetical protein
LTLLHDEFPRAYFQICSALAGRRISLAIGGDRMTIEVARFGIGFSAPTEDADVRVASDNQTILDTIDARLTLEGAIRSARLFAAGKHEDLEACHQALLAFVRGAVRSPSFPPLLEEFRWASAPPSGPGQQPVE